MHYYLYSEEVDPDRVIWCEDELDVSLEVARLKLEHGANINFKVLVAVEFKLD